MTPELRNILETCFCGCGEPELAIETMRDVLRLMNAEYKSRTANEHVLRLEELIGLESKGIFWGYLYFLDSVGLIEHGVGIRSSWLTDLGKEFLDYIENHGADADKWPDVL